LSKANSIAMGNCLLTNVPVALADESSVNVDISLPETGSQISRITQLPHLHGLPRVREMRVASGIKLHLSPDQILVGEGTRGGVST
jgi:hypothetical protein